MNKNNRKNRLKKGSARQRVSFWPALKAGGTALLAMAGFFLLAAAFIFFHDALIQCDYFNAESINVRGMERLSREMVLDTAGLEGEVNIIAVNLSMVRKRLVAYPWIRSASVRRELPSRLSVSVREHRPLAVLDVGRFFLIDSRGSIFKEAAPPEMTGLPIISGLECADWKKPDGSRTKVSSAVMSLLQCLEDGAGPRGLAVHEIAVDREMGLTVWSNGPAERIHLGYDGYEQKLQRIRRIFAYIEANRELQPLEYLNAQNPKRIVATPAEQKSSEANKEV
ncbi:MAG: FtsQ-type POTRA domain-containing protein [Desulfosalsimonadaceae bacterium]